MSMSVYSRKPKYFVLYNKKKVCRIMVAMEELMFYWPNNPILLAIDPDTSKNIGILAKYTRTMNPNGNRKPNYYIFEI